MYPIELKAGFQGDIWTTKIIETLIRVAKKVESKQVYICG
jgi:hypothetical protein